MDKNKNPRNGWNSNPLQCNVDFTKVQNSTATAKTAEAGRGEASKVVTDIISHAGTSDKVSLHHENVLPIDGLPNHVQVCLKHWQEAFQ